MTTVDLNLVRFCCAEVERQHASPRAVYWMMQAWIAAKELYHSALPIITTPYPHLRMLEPNDVERWGEIVEPELNLYGFRQIAVFVGDKKCPDASEVSRLMKQLLSPETLTRLSPDEIYKEFEEIHPFEDGNGRVGKILYNFLSHSLHNPKLPPFFWGIANG